MRYHVCGGTADANAAYVQEDYLADLVVYGSPVSPFVRKVEAVLAEKHCEYDFETVNVFDPPDWFLEMSPLKTIPVLRDRSVGKEGALGSLADSSAICGFLEQRQPEHPLYPADPYDHGRALFIEEYADTRLAATGGLGIFRPIFFAASSGKEPDVAKAQSTWTGKMPAVLDYLEGALADGKFFAGSAFSIADISVAVQLMQLELVADAALGPRWPGLADHLKRTRARESMSASFARADRFVRKVLPERAKLEG